jgi:hypothetical protein
LSFAITRHQQQIEYFPSPRVDHRLELNKQNAVPRLLIVIIRIVVGVYVGLCLMLFLFQRSMIYYPQPRSNSDGITLEKLDMEGTRVLVSTRPRAGDQAVIYFGGNAEDVSLDMPDFVTTFPNAAIYLLHYPGYGGSSGKPSEPALTAAGFALFDRVRTEHPNVIVIGRSLGTGVAVQVAS